VSTNTDPRLNLASIRQRKGVTLEEITQSTKIGSQFLQAIEAEEFNELPGGVYSTSYIRQYARAIGYSETELLDQYYAKSGVEPMRVIEAQQDNRATTRLGHWKELFLGHLSARPRAQRTV
jgi:cytoskeletal protein RodZ